MNEHIPSFIIITECGKKIRPNESFLNKYKEIDNKENITFFKTDSSFNYKNSNAYLDVIQVSL